MHHAYQHKHLYLLVGIAPPESEEMYVPDWITEEIHYLFGYIPVRSCIVKEIHNGTINLQWIWQSLDHIEMPE